MQVDQQLIDARDRSEVAKFQSCMVTRKSLHCNKMVDRFALLIPSQSGIGAAEMMRRSCQFGIN